VQTLLEKAFTKLFNGNIMMQQCIIIYMGKMKDLTDTKIPEEMNQIKVLAAIWLSKTKSEELKKGIRQLQYGRIKKIKEVREILDKALKKEELSSLIRKMREEETH